VSTALVLGGGGPVGVAWEAGVLAGLADAGVDLSRPDRIVGTSAGSLVGARLALTGDAVGLVGATDRVARGNDRPAPQVDLTSLMAVGRLMRDAMAGGDTGTIVREAGRLALAADTMDEDDFVAMTGRGLGDEWPDVDYRCTAWDTESGEFRVWDAASGAPLERAVATSCSVPGIFPPVTVDGRRYMDGGILSASNAFLAEGCDHVVVLSVITGAMAGVAEHLRAPFLDELEGLRAGGSSVEAVEMSAEAFGLCGGNLMDYATVGAVAEAGRVEGRAAGERIGAVWVSR
jgi:NTE family protein